MENKLVNKSKKINLAFLLLLNFVFIFSYKLFIFLIISGVILFNNTIYSKIEKFLILLIPFSFYIYNFSKIFLEKPKQSSIFWDMQDFIHFLNCNYNPDTLHIYRYINDERQCVDSIGYGLLSNILYLKTDIWLSTIFVFCLFLLNIFILIYFIKVDSWLLTIFLVSPSFHFLAFSLNADIFVLVFLIYLFYKIEKNLGFFDLLILSILIQIKIYPIFVLVGYFIIKFVNKDTKKIQKYSIGLFLALNTILIIYFYFFLNSFLPDPLSYTRTFGIYHDYLLMYEVVGFNEALLTLALIFIIFTLIFKYQKNRFKQILKFNLNQNEYTTFLVFSFLALFINLFQNWGYKFVFNFFIIFLIYKSTKNLMTKLFLSSVVLTNTTYYLIGYGFESSIQNIFFLAASKVIFYLYFVLISYYFYLILKKYLSINL